MTEREKDDFAKLLEDSFGENFEICKREKNWGEERGKFGGRNPVSSEKIIDLHGLNREEAEKLVETFIKELLKGDFSKLKIITGKGNHSREGAVLPAAVDNLLKSLKKQNRIKFKWEKGVVFGSGYVEVTI